MLANHSKFISVIMTCLFMGVSLVQAQEDNGFITKSELLESIVLNTSSDSEEILRDTEKYIVNTGDFDILKHPSYEVMEGNTSYIALREKYLFKFNVSTFFYLYVGLIGIFIALLLNLRKRRTDRVANALIGGFVFMHSVFLVHVSLYLTNYTFYVPHTLSMSTIFSFLYGPILYFYFKRITEGYVFKKNDVFHLLPTIILITFFIPIYGLSAQEKLEIMLGVGVYDNHPYLIPITIVKLISLISYGYLTYCLYKKSASKALVAAPKKVRLQKMIMIIHTVYALSYAIYAVVIIQYIFSGVIFHVQLFSMTALVLYIAYIAYVNPKILAGQKEFISSVENKYRNSGLTPSFSLELKDALVKLLEEEKLYRQNSIKLESIAQRLGTTRHNASQVINEHFALNFFELINKYRVEEAMELLSGSDRDLNIIDVAYEVGYNNKVTFNKSFKRFVNLTPSQFKKAQLSA